jgi:hypothetical protein
LNYFTQTLIILHGFQFIATDLFPPRQIKIRRLKPKFYSISLIIENSGETKPPIPDEMEPPIPAQTEPLLLGKFVLQN